MRNASEQLLEVLEYGDYDVFWAADLLYDNSPRAQNLKVLEPKFSWSRSSQIEGKGTCEILWDDIFGQSIVPREIGDLFSPFGAELQVDVIVSTGEFEERVSMGRFVLDSVPASVEYAIQHPHGGIPVVAESRVSLDLADYFLRIARDSFAFPTSPQSTSMWDEAQRLTGLPVFKSIPDRVLPTNLAYEDDRLNALESVFSPSNAWPSLTPAGALTALPKDWTDPVGRIERVLDVSSEMRSENVYNRVVVEGKNPDTSGPPLIAVAEITDGLLRTRNADGSRSPFGGNTYPYRSDFLTTQQQCQNYADELLPKVSRMRAITRTIEIPFNPLHEVGDVNVLVDPTRQGEESIVRITAVSHPGGATTTLQVEVTE
ncbi:hypothetical protein ACI3KS_05095 [Microbacterium sp. ZW T5_45]|uniref:hypothetical protein n=1 Tax=Microbacterium sp. ZW T5_45 TaxID=3378080 RepID=UPI0038522E97